MNRRRLFAFYWMPALVWMALIFVASTAAGLQENSMRLIVNFIKLLAPDQAGGLPADTLSHINIIARKFAHLSEYAILALLAFRAVQSGIATLKWKSATLGVALPVLYACTDEFHQSFVPGRTAAVQDVIIDSVGALFAIMAVLLFFWLKTRERHLLQSSYGPSVSETAALPDYQNT